MTALELVRTAALQHDIDRYLAAKRKKLTAKSERGYVSTLAAFARHYPAITLADLEPPRGTILIEDFLNETYGHLAPRTYNKAFSVIHTFVEWHVARAGLVRDPMATLERATPRQFHRKTFTEEEWLRIFAANPDPHDQIALHLLLDYGLRKGALRNVQFEHFDPVNRRLTIFTKGEKIFEIPIPDGRIWQLLDQIREPRHHYLLCKHKTRRRRPLQRAEITAAAWLVDEATAMLARVTDPACAREIEMGQPAVDHLRRWIGLAADAASVQVRRFPAEQIGEHGAHDWWYGCLQRAGVVEKGVTSGVRMHSARHTAAQRMLEATGNVKSVQALLCHANIAVTDAYIGWDSEKLENDLAYVGKDGTR